MTTDTHRRVEEAFGDYLDRQFAHIIRRLEEMESSISGQLAGIASDEATLAEVIPTIASAYEEKAQALAAVEAKIASGELVEPTSIAAELAPIKAGLDADLANIQKISLSPAPAAAPTKSVYTFSADSGAATDERFSVSGFETAPADGSAPQPLLYFSGDVNADEQNGASIAGYVLYGGAVQAAA